jgi:hypothetical protein
MTRAWQDQSITPLDEPWPLQAWPDVPSRVLAGRHDRMFPLGFQRRVARQRLALEVDEIDGGHVVAMSNPAELADRLEAYRLDDQDDAATCRPMKRIALTTSRVARASRSVGEPGRDPRS